MACFVSIESSHIREESQAKTMAQISKFPSSFRSH